MNKYSYKGIEGFLAHTDEVEATPVKVFSEDLGFYPAECYNGVSALSYDDSYTGCCCGGEIVDGIVVNVENDQRLEEGVPVTKEYQELDEANRMLNVLTDRYYDWTSELTEIVKRIEEDDDVNPEYYKKEWEEICSRYPKGAAYLQRIEDFL